MERPGRRWKVGPGRYLFRASDQRFLPRPDSRRAASLSTMAFSLSSLRGAMLRIAAAVTAGPAARRHVRDRRREHRGERAGVAGIVDGTHAERRIVLVETAVEREARGRGLADQLVGVVARRVGLVVIHLILGDIGVRAGCPRQLVVGAGGGESQIFGSRWRGPIEIGVDARG